MDTRKLYRSSNGMNDATEFPLTLIKLAAVFRAEHYSCNSRSTGAGSDQRGWASFCTWEYKHNYYMHGFHILVKTLNCTRIHIRKKKIPWGYVPTWWSPRTWLRSGFRTGRPARARFPSSLDGWLKIWKWIRVTHAPHISGVNVYKNSTRKIQEKSIMFRSCPPTEGGWYKWDPDQTGQTCLFLSIQCDG